ncbi:sensor domain-containing diguanylate cyclase [Aneurinibacillus aneurinilyticus]|uniref:sensor domain-containing diguanylate cyclase n=1 Tax=Aneurinibacillus aneurinilyticus TaxID=1391 RepID=UPI0023F2847D|nr:diguanylate cyclase [Aneurinibacillus aneurinilyticus]
MKKRMINQNRKETFLADYYSAQIINVFRKSFRFISSPSFLLNKGWIFISDKSGNVLAFEKVGAPEFEIKPFYPIQEMDEHSQNDMTSKVMYLPILGDTWFPGFIGMVLPLSVDEKQVSAFLQGFVNVFCLMQEQSIAKEIAYCIRAVNQDLHLDNVMQTIVHRITLNLTLSDCIAVVFDEEQSVMLPRWSSSEQKLLQWQTKILNNPKKIYENIVARFSAKRRVLHNDNANLEELLGSENTFSERWLIAPFRYNGKIIGFLLLMRDTEHPFTTQEQKFVCRFTKDLSLAVHNSTVYMRTQRDEQKQAMLFEITKKFHSSINVDNVLQAVIENTRKLYPDMSVDLWLSHDSFSTTLPVKQFSYSIDGNSVSAQAFMEARTVIIPSDGERSLTLAAPLRGKQGVYGVLELYSDKPISLPSREVEYITMLADTAGNAFENAQLYEQSNRLIKELLLIDEMTRQLNKNIKLHDLLEFIMRKLTESFRTEHCCIFSWSDEKNAFIMRASTQKEIKEFALPVPTAGKLYDLFVRKESILLADGADAEIGVPSFSYKSLMAVPLLEKEEVNGAIMLLDSKPHRYTFDDFKRLEMLARHVKVAVTNASLHAEVERMVVTDNLTGLYNRKYLYDSIRQSQKRDVCGSLILIDVDHFKNVNDTYGHHIGDEILVQVANELTVSIRTSDIAARWGGEEMAVYLPKVQSDIAQQVAERLRLNVMRKTHPTVTISSGIATWTKEDGILSVEQLFQRADEALYQAKRAGRNQVRMAEFA